MNPRRFSGIAAALVFALAASPGAWATWAVVLTDVDTGEVAIGQATCVSGIDLRSLSAVVVTERGVATVQAFVDASGVARNGIRNGLLAGTAPNQILQTLRGSDPDYETHQYCIVDTQGRAVTYTGTVPQGSSFDFAGGQTGQVGSVHYCVAGNVITGQPVIDEAVLALQATAGSLADKLLAAMDAARAMGGDGRCSCSPSDPTGCGSPPPAFDASAINGYLVLARIDDTSDCAACAGGDYYLDLNVAFQNGGDTDPVLLLQTLYDGFRLGLAGRPDAVRSQVSIDPAALLPDGSSSAQMGVTLLDLDGAPLGISISSFTVSQAPGSAGAASIGAPTSNGSGNYTVPLVAGTVPGVDRFHVTADDGQRPVTLMPPPRLPVGIPGEVGNVRWSDAVTLEWDTTLAADTFHVYRGELALLGCGFFGDCLDPQDPDLSDLVLSEPTLPVPEAGFFYLVTSEDTGGVEGSAGPSSCGLRVLSTPCP